VQIYDKTTPPSRSGHRPTAGGRLPEGSDFNRREEGPLSTGLDTQETLSGAARRKRFAQRLVLPTFPVEPGQSWPHLPRRQSVSARCEQGLRTYPVRMNTTVELQRRLPGTPPPKERVALERRAKLLAWSEGEV